MKPFLLLFCEITCIGLFIVRTATYIGKYKPRVCTPAFRKIVKNTANQRNS